MDKGCGRYGEGGVKKNNYIGVHAVELDPTFLFPVKKNET